jgi:hypothetical protein
MCRMPERSSSGNQGRTSSHQPSAAAFAFHANQENGESQMTRRQLSAFALSLMLAGCASVKVGTERPIKVGERTVTLSGLDGFNSAAVQAPDPNYVLVYVDSDGITINQEPVRPKTHSGYVTITWALDGSGYTFPDDGITFPSSSSNPPPNPLPDCTVVAPQKLAIVCSYRNAGPKKFKYNIRVVDGAGHDQRLDPWVHQP